MFVVTSLAFHALINAVAICIGLSTEARAILGKRAELAVACAREGSDERYAFELADVDRVGVEKRLWRAGLMGALVYATAATPGHMVARAISGSFDWSALTTSRMASVFGLCATIVWSGHAVRRNAASRHWNAA
jgi:hypothetical protein